MQLFGILLAVFFLAASDCRADFIFDPDVPLAIREQLKNDLAFLGSLEGKKVSSFHRKIFGSLSGKNYVGFFEKRIKEIGLDACGGSIAFACVVPLLEDNKMYFAPNFSIYSLPQITRVMMLIHESRHTEARQNYWAHLVCPDPFVDENGKQIVGTITGKSLAGRPACDASEFAAYGLDRIFMRNIEKNCDNCGQKVRMDANIFGSAALDRIIDPRAKRRLLRDLPDSK
jgi:hypothetical protein